MFERFVVEELPRYRLNIRSDSPYFKLTTDRLRAYLAKYLPENEVSGALIALMTRIDYELNRLGYEVIRRHKGTIIIRQRVVENGD